MLDLTSERIADAEACGVSFPAATHDQVQRYAMQKKVFRIGGAAVLATRDGALFETAGTLERLIAEGERQRRDLAEWEAAASPLVEEAPAPSPPARAAASAPSPALVPVPEPRTPRSAKPRRAPRGERWLTVGAERRGRLAQHWSTRRQGR